MKEKITAALVLLALSIVGLGDLLSPAERLACRMADPGCTATQQLSNTGGQLDNAISSIGVLLLVIAAFFLAAAMRPLYHIPRPPDMLLRLG